MSIRTINYTVSVGGITPASQQFGGTQGDHNAVELKFTIDTELYNSITANTEGTVYYRFDGYDGSGGMKSTEPAPLDDNVCTYGLEEWITRYGGKVQVYLVLTDITDTTEMELYSFPAVLNLKDRPDGHLVDGGDYESISTLYEGAKASADKAEEAATCAEQVLDDIGGAVPDIDITEVSDGVEITVTSKEGIETAKVYNGRDGTDGKDGKDVDYSLVANALKGSASGGVVVIKDVSPLPHDVKVKVEMLPLLDGYLPDNGEIIASGSHCYWFPDGGVSEFTVRTKTKIPYYWGLCFATDQDTQFGGGADEIFGVTEDCYWFVSYANNTWLVSFYRDAEGTDLIKEFVVTEYYPNTKILTVESYGEDNDEVVITQSSPSAEVKLYGKNLLPDKKVFVSGGNIYLGVTVYTQSVPLKKGTYTLSIVSDVVATGMYIVSSDGKTTLASDFNRKNRITFTLEEDTSVRLRAYSTQFTSKDDVVSAQIELGSSVTEYEPYIEPTTHTVMADGTAFESVYPSMTFVPETDGVELSVEYNRDINKAFAELQTALISMGGNV